MDPNLEKVNYQLYTHQTNKREKKTKKHQWVCDGGREKDRGNFYLLPRRQKENRFRGRLVLIQCGMEAVKIRFRYQ